MRKGGSQEGGKKGNCPEDRSEDRSSSADISSCDISYSLAPFLPRLTCNYASISISPSPTARHVGAPEHQHVGTQEKVGKHSDLTFSIFLLL